MKDNLPEELSSLPQRHFSRRCRRGVEKGGREDDLMADDEDRCESRQSVGPIQG